MSEAAAPDAHPFLLSAGDLESLEHAVASMDINGLANTGTNCLSEEVWGAMLRLFVVADCIYKSGGGRATRAANANVISRTESMQLDFIVNERFRYILVALAGPDKARFEELCQQWRAAGQNVRDAGMLLSPTPKGHNNTSVKLQRQLYATFCSFFTDHPDCCSPATGGDQASFMANLFQVVKNAALIKVETGYKYNIGDEDLIGEGSFSRVYKGEDDQGRSVAVKVFKIGAEQPDQKIDDIRNECKAIMDCREMCPLIPCLIYEPCYNELYPFAVMEFLEGGTFDRYLVDARITPARRMADLPIFGRKMAACLIIFDDKKIVHRDLKPENIGMKISNDVSSLMVFDLGLKTKHRKRASTRAGTDKYMAPEVASVYDAGCYRASSAIDVYSLGCIFIELVVGAAEFENIVDNGLKPYSPDLVRSVLKGHHAPESFVDLVLRMTDPKPSERPTPVVIHDHEFFCTAPNPFDADDLKSLSRVHDKATIKHLEEKLAKCQAELEVETARRRNLEEEAREAPALDDNAKRVMMRLAYNALRLERGAHKAPDTSGITLNDISRDVSRALNGIVTDQEVSDYLLAGKPDRIIPPQIFTASQLDTIRPGLPASQSLIGKNEANSHRIAVGIGGRSNSWDQLRASLIEYHRVYWVDGEEYLIDGDNDEQGHM